MTSELDEDELTVLEYARFHKLCKPYQSEKFEISIPEVASDTGDQYVLFPSDADITEVVPDMLRERLRINKDAALLLRSIHDSREAPKREGGVGDEWDRIKSLKHELPLLKTDAELDLLSFGDDRVPSFHDLRIPTEVVDDENDEGFAWPAKYFKYPEQCLARIRWEKLGVSRDVACYLQEIKCDTYSSVDADKAKTESLLYTKNEATQPITPPLLPLSPPLIPYVPSSPANQIPLPSESSDSIATEAKTLCEQIMAADSIIRDDSESVDSMLLELTHPSDLPSVFESQPEPTSKRRAEDLKVEGPLTPPMFSDSPAKKLKSVSFTADLHEIIPNTLWAPAFNDENLSEGGSSGLDNIFPDLEPFAEKARQMIENEKLSAADTTARVDVPDVDFTLPTAPWHEYSRRRGGKHRPGDTEIGAQMKFLLRVKHEDLRTVASWHGVSALERELKWNIFTTNVPKVTIAEKLHGETDLRKIAYDGMGEDIATSSSLVWKREGLRVLDEEEDEEGIDFAETEEEEEMKVLIRKRKLEIDEEDADEREKVVKSVQLTSMPVREKEISISSNLDEQDDQLQAPQLRIGITEQSGTGDLMFGGFSAKTALHRFMKTRGREVKKVEVTNNAHGKGTVIQKVPSLVNNRDLSTQPQYMERNLEDKKTIRDLPQLPALPTTLPPCFIILSMVYLQQRSFTKQIQSLYPAAEVVYRDYKFPHSPSNEADMILSPSTGLITATLQQIKQRPLPGQADRNPVKERMASLQSRYERLVLLISEGLSREMEAHGSSRPEDQRDAEAIGDFESLAGKLDGEVIVQYVRGGEQALAHTIVLEMAKYCLPQGSDDIGDIQLLPVETTWELFLRRAGLNPFAAQVIVAWLKNPFEVSVPLASSSPGYSESPRAVSVSGLPGFLMISGDERIRFFQALMGGSRILKRVNSVLEQQWPSAVHGFKNVR